MLMQAGAAMQSTNSYCFTLQMSEFGMSMAKGEDISIPSRKQVAPCDLVPELTEEVARSFSEESPDSDEPQEDTLLHRNGQQFKQISALILLKLKELKTAVKVGTRIK